MLLVQQLFSTAHLFHLLIQELLTLLQSLTLAHGALLPLADPRDLLLEGALTSLFCLRVARRALAILLLQPLLIRKSFTFLRGQPLLVLDVRPVAVTLPIQFAQAITVARQQAILILQSDLILRESPIAVEVAIHRSTHPATLRGLSSGTTSRALSSTTNLGCDGDRRTRQ